MPAYDYKCKTCGHTETVVRGMTGSFTPPECPTDSKVMVRVFSAPAGIVIK